MHYGIGSTGNAYLPGNNKPISACIRNLILCSHSQYCTIMIRYKVC